MTRSRSRVTGDVNYRFKSIVHDHGASRDDIDSSTPVDHYWSQTTTDVVTPGFKRLRNSGAVVNSPYSMVEVKVTDSSHLNAEFSEVIPEADRDFHYYEWQWNLFSNMVSAGHIRFHEFNTDVSQDRKRAMISCIGNVNKTEFDAGTFIAEFSKTKRLHLDLINAIKRMLTESRQWKKGRYFYSPLYDSSGRPLLTKRGRLRYTRTEVPGYFKGGEFTSHLSNVADVYLAFRYGLMPLIHDLESAVNYIRKSKWSERNTARGTYSFSDSSSEVQSYYVGGGDYYLRKDSSIEVQGRFGILYQTDPDASRFAALGVTRPLSTAWELVPFSFVVDWVVDVGGWLDAIQPSLSTKVLASWESLSVTQIDTVSVNGFIRNDNFKYHGAHWHADLTGAYSRVTRRKTRNPWNASVPLSPAFGTGLNFLRSVDAVALMLQQLRRFK